MRRSSRRRLLPGWARQGESPYQLQPPPPHENRHRQRSRCSSPSCEALPVAPREQVLCASFDSRGVVHCEIEGVGQSVGHTECEAFGIISASFLECARGTQRSDGEQSWNAGICF
jgi:hypothetical protein